MLSKAYRPYRPSEAAIALAREIAALLTERAATYQEANDALEAASELLLHESRPVKSQTEYTFQPEQGWNP